MVDLINLQHAIVESLVSAIPSGWKQIISSYEIDDDDAETTQNTITVWIYEEKGDIRSASLESAPNAINNAFFALNEAMGKSRKERWCSTEIKIEEDGAYKMTYSYDPPARINAEFNYESYDKFDQYAEIYKAEKRLSSS